MSKLDDFLATEIMGWHEAVTGWRWVSDNPKRGQKNQRATLGHGLMKDWKPTKDLNQTFMVLNKAGIYCDFYPQKRDGDTVEVELTFMDKELAQINVKKDVKKLEDLPLKISKAIKEICEVEAERKAFRLLVKERKMPKYIKKPVPVEAKQWFKDGDHEKVKDYFNYNEKCLICGKPTDGHGELVTLEGGRIICPSDWIIKDENGYSVVKDSIFKEIYEEVGEGFDSPILAPKDEPAVFGSSKTVLLGTEELEKSWKAHKTQWRDIAELEFDEAEKSLNEELARISKDYIKQYQREVKGLKEERRRLKDENRR